MDCHDGDTCYFALPRVMELVPELAPLFGGERIIPPEPLFSLLSFSK